MPDIISKLLADGDSGLRGRIIGVYVLLIGVTVLVWAWALAVLHDKPVLLGTALLAYSFGLRHAVDADHIAAIDNVTRKLMQQGQRPVGVGLCFSLGHSAFVVLLSIAVAFAASAVSVASIRSKRSATSSERPFRRCSCSRSRSSIFSY